MTRLCSRKQRGGERVHSAAGFPSGDVPILSNGQERAKNPGHGSGQEVSRGQRSSRILAFGGAGEKNWNLVRLGCQ